LLNLPRLSWLAYAGNPFTETLEVQALNDTPVSAIHWDRLTLREPLGVLSPNPRNFRLPNFHTRG
jgi:hypothetical protein